MDDDGTDHFKGRTTFKTTKKLKIMWEQNINLEYHKNMKIGLCESHLNKQRYYLPISKIILTKQQYL